MFTLLTIVVAVALALATGGRPRHLTEHSFRFGALPLVGVFLDVAAETDRLHGVWFLLTIASYLCLIGFVIANWRLTGIFLVLVGLGLNFLTIAVNRGMPVRPSTLISAGVVDDMKEARAYDYGAKHHIEGPDDTLMLISDVIPFRPIKKVLSIGDLVMAAGIGVVVFHLLRPPPTRRRGVRRSASDRRERAPTPPA